MKTFKTKTVTARRNKKPEWKKFLISYEWDLDKIPISEQDLISKHPELELMIKSLSQEESFLMRVGKPGSRITIESNWQ